MSTAKSDVRVSCQNGFHSGIKGLWNSRLRSYRCSSVESSTPSRSTLSATPSSQTAAGLTDTPSSRRSCSVRVASTGRLTQGYTPTPASDLRRRSSSTALSHRERSITPAKSLFRNFLLQAFEPHEPTPALTVVLDLDETLVSNRSEHLTQAVLRPYCVHVLCALRHMKNLEIVLWTASTKKVAAPVVEQFHKNGFHFDDVIYRNDMWFVEPAHTKDLRLLGRDLDRLVIVDNAPNCCKLNPHNAILIEDFHGTRHADDAALVNVYYVIEALLSMCTDGISVRDGLMKLSQEEHLCHRVVLKLPEWWRSMPLEAVNPLLVPPSGVFVKANTAPPLSSIMKYWTY